MTTAKSEAEVEQMIKDAALTAPRITPTDVDNEIVTVQYHIFPGTTTTVCCLTLYNGFTVIGESAAASPENFNEAIGQKIAFEKAREKIWAFLGFRLKDKLANLI